jgi:hypothetical protein
VVAVAAVDDVVVVAAVEGIVAVAGVEDSHGRNPFKGLAARDAACGLVARNRPEWALAGPMTTPRYTSISAIGNRVTAVTCRTSASAVAS